MSEAAVAPAVVKLKELLVVMQTSDIWSQIVAPRDEVFARFRPVFAPEHIPELTADEFWPFLYFEYNHHWTGLHRQVNRLCGDMPSLRRALSTLLDEGEPVDRRLDAVAGSVKGLGKGTMTAILHVAHPDRYGVWNNTSEGALVTLGIFPDFDHGASFGTRYAMINDLLRRLADALQVDLWTLDALWWLFQQGDVLPNGAAAKAVVGVSAPLSGSIPSATAAASFGLERHLHDFMFDNWDRLDIGREWAIYATPEDPEAGYEYPCAVGRIDILAKHRSQNKWLVVELKRGDTSDSVVGQALRYMGWVKQHLAESADEVHGLIIAYQGDAALHYAVSGVPNLSFQIYEVEFRLKTPVPPTA